MQDLIREDYVAVVDADEYLHPGLFDFIVEENVDSLAMPWRCLLYTSPSPRD